MTPILLTQPLHKLMPTYLFTIQDLLDLINESSAVRSLKPLQLLETLKIAHAPESEQAQSLYFTLITERAQYIEIDKKNLSETKKIYTNFQIELESLKHQDIYQKIKQAEKKYEKTEEQITQKLLKSLKNK